MHILRTFLIALTLLAACASHAAAQSAAAPQSPAPSATPAQAAPDSLFQLGDRNVIIPSPAGFVEATSRNSTVKTAFGMMESETLDLLAVHIPADVLKRIEGGERPELDFYTKISLSKRTRAVKTTQAEFASLVAYMRANNSKVKV